MEEETVVMPQGEEGTVSEFKEEEGDDLAIIRGEKPVFDVMLQGWNEEGDPGDPSENGELHLVLAKNKKFYQRGLVELTIGQERVIVHMDALMSCIYSVYEMPNPYKNYNPNRPVLNAIGVIEETHVEESKDGPEHYKRDLVAVGLDDLSVREVAVNPNAKKRLADLVVAIEEVNYRD